MKCFSAISVVLKNFINPILILESRVIYTNTKCVKKQFKLLPCACALFKN